MNHWTNPKLFSFFCSFYFLLSVLFQVRNIARRMVAQWGFAKDVCAALADYARRAGILADYVSYLGRMIRARLQKTIFFLTKMIAWSECLFAASVPTALLKRVEALAIVFRTSLAFREAVTRLSRFFECRTCLFHVFPLVRSICACLEGRSCDLVFLVFFPVSSCSFCDHELYWWLCCVPCSFQVLGATSWESPDGNGGFGPKGTPRFFTAGNFNS